MSDAGPRPASPGAAATPGFVEPLGHGVHAVDTGFARPRFDAAYVVVDGARAVVVDTGPNSAVPRLLAALEALGVARDAVDHVVATHVHLDHAGGVGALMRELPAATLLVHPRGARHLIDPSALYAGALAVYGQAAMDRDYGTIVPVDASRVMPTSDAMRLRWQRRTFEFADTPGHARHHHCIWDDVSRGWFTGDTFGLAYPELAGARGAFVTPTATPVQFEPQALRASIDRLLARAPRTMYLTHYGAVGGDADGRAVRDAGAMLQRHVDALEAIGRRCDGPDPDARDDALRAALRAFYRAELVEHGVADADAALAPLDIDVRLNAQGLAVWLDRDARRDTTIAAARGSQETTR